MDAVGEIRTRTGSPLSRIRAQWSPRPPRLPISPQPRCCCTGRDAGGHSLERVPPAARSPSSRQASCPGVFTPAGGFLCGNSSHHPFVKSQRMAPYVGRGLGGKLENPLIFQAPSAGGNQPPPSKINGYDVTILVDVCKAVVAACVGGSSLVVGTDLYRDHYRRGLTCG